ncbi:MAG: HD domain-containing protein [Candidatus Nanoarchaeia archaeon]|nr:HD domain-containing protein [Candidatus Nanoarchaeia archaeon]
MEINDEIYGKTIITEPVLIELINSRPVQRLKGITQKALHFCRPDDLITRYGHSVGVMILLNKFGASVEEQIAGLLHDVPHTAFSHVADSVFENNEQEFHEEFHEKIIRESEIPSILGRYGYDLNRILDISNFQLLEKKIPELCADRIDYLLRDMSVYMKKGKEYLPHLRVSNNQILVDNKKVAIDLAYDYLNMDKEVYARNLSSTVYWVLSQAIKIAMKNSILTQEDLFKDDNYVYNKLKGSGNAEILKYLNFLNPKLTVIENPLDYDFLLTEKKPRWIDPCFFEENKIKRVSEVAPEFKTEVEAHKKRIMGNRFIKIIKY